MNLESFTLIFNKIVYSEVAYTYADTQNLLDNRDIPFQPQHISRVWGEWRSADLPLTLWTEGVYQSQSKNDMANTFFKMASRHSAGYFINCLFLPLMEFF